jgi:putative protein-disulfide isomerase
MNNEMHAAGRVEITYYTDPLCCWSWAMEPQWRKLLRNYHHEISWRYVMGGLLPDWKTYHDPEHSVSRPIQMGPVWMHASQLSGMPMNSRLWFEDPPQSSYPACIAFACVAHQSREAAEIYLRRLREAVMMEGKNTAEKQVLLTLAEELKHFISIAQFENDLVDETGIRLFHQHLDEVKKRQIQRYPTFLFRYNSQAMIATGYRPYHQLEEILQKLVPGITPVSAHSHDVFPWLSPTVREQEELV